MNIRVVVAVASCCCSTSDRNISVIAHSSCEEVEIKGEYNRNRGEDAGENSRVGQI